MSHYEPQESPFDFINFARSEPNKKTIKHRKTQFYEIYQAYSDEAARRQARRCLDCGNPYCEWQCPVHNFIPNWLELLKNGHIIAAAELCHETNSLPEICGRVCPQDRLCEGACTLDAGFGAVTIGQIEKYITDTAFAMGWRPNIQPLLDPAFKVAVVGAGPAGLACADRLIRQGIQVTVFDRYAEIGGLLTYGIPSFKLEKQVMQLRRTVFSEMGIVFQLNTEVGKDMPVERLLTDYDALFLATGTYKAITGHFPGEDLPGVIPALPFLVANTQALLQEAPNAWADLSGKRVVVLGGGDTAMDCNRTAVRLGAKSVTCIYRRDEQSMPGSRRELKHAREEGTEFLFCRQPIAMTGDHQVTGVTTLATEAGAQFGLQVLVGTEFWVPADLVIVAFGFEPSPPTWLADLGVTLDNRGLVQTSEQQSCPLQTTNPKIFAGGDMVKGSDLVVTAIGQGRQAALGIMTYLGVATDATVEKIAS